ncbi:hypothetical protein KUCAC02_015131 [Chaenocephalus aceratus]|uniref:Uncharacterized protein n=1 Tax=Chaenocephalus aceratus TaxID=36190 RepID=A0ACB9XZ23_CHAAC|nr:hypothetical protein KUCAC02_015131 [Chaenocephalus aceratus]
MGGGATRLYSALTPPLSSSPPPPPAVTNLDPAFCQEVHSAAGWRRRPSSSIRVMQWNILAQALGEGLDSFVQCPPEALSWSRRKYLILEEILTYRPHILCLQEVDHYYDTLQPVFAGLGYSSNFCPKPWSPCLDVEGNNGPDGCALVNLQLSTMRIPTNQVAVVTMLRCRSSGRCVCVAVTHLKARSGWEWLRSAQGSDLLRHLQTLVQKHGHDSAGAQTLDIPLLYVEISTPSRLRRCTDVSPHRLLVWTPPTRGSVRTVPLSRSTQRGRSVLRVSAAQPWTTSGTVGTH